MKRNSSNNAGNPARKRDGFTLVELVVVIAVLAILAGVGAIAYRGYINYAKKAGDLELLEAVNNAFSSACLEYNIDRNDLPNGGATLASNDDDHKTINGVSYVYPIYIGGTTTNTDEFTRNFSDEFLYVFEPNDNIEMQYYTTDQIRFSGKEHMFVFEENATFASGGIFGGTSFEGKDVGAMSQSTRWGSALMDSLLKYDNTGTNRKTLSDTLRGAINGSLEDKVNAFFTGLKNSDLGNISELQEVNQDELIDKLEELGVNSSNPSYTEVMNGMILASLQNAVTDDNINSFNDGNLKGTEALPLWMAEMTAFYNSDYAGKGFKDKYNELFQIGKDADGDLYTGGVSANDLNQLKNQGESFWSSLDGGTGWNEYKNSEQAGADMDLYIQALQEFSNSNPDLSSTDMFGDFLRTWQPKQSEEQ